MKNKNNRGVTLYSLLFAFLVTKILNASDVVWIKYYENNIKAIL